MSEPSELNIDLEEENRETETDRREFVKCACTIACGGVALLAPISAATLVYLDPLFKKSGEKPFLKIANLDTLPADGTPRKFSIVTSIQDAWNRYSAAPVGAIFLRRVSENEVVALNAKCPHTGCQVDARPETESFFCGCHNSSFAIDGSINDPASPSPRGMDELEVEVRDDSEVWVKFENFKTGHQEQIPVV